MDSNQKLDITPVHSSILKKFYEYQQESLKEIFEILSNNFHESLLYIFIEDLNSNQLIDVFKFYINDKESLKNYEINKNLSYYTNNIYKKKYYLHYFLFPYRKNFLERICNYILPFDKVKTLCLISSPSEIEKIYNKVHDYHNYINPSNLLIKILNFINGLLINKPIKFVTFIIGFYISYPLFLMFLQGLKPDEIDISTLSFSTELFIILVVITISFLFLPILYFPIKMMGLKTKYILTFFILITLLFSFISMFLDGIEILFLKKPVKEVFQNSLLTDMYLKVKKYPRFATLVIKDTNTKKNITVLIRFVDNKYIYYNNICDFNFSKINSQNNTLTVLKFLANKANEPLSAIATSKINKILNIKYTINKQEFCRICNCRVKN